jgi:hypothetical protein
MMHGVRIKGRVLSCQCIPVSAQHLVHNVELYVYITVVLLQVDAMSTGSC